MNQSSWEQWVQLIAQDYGIHPGKAGTETEKQRRILEAALHIFSEKGYEGASTKMIAKQAEVAEATIFKHYKSKKGLLIHLVFPAISKVATPYLVRPVLKILDQEKPLEELFAELYANRIKLVEENWKKVKVLVVESMFHPELREALQQHVASSFYEVMAERIEKWKEEGRLRADLPTSVIARSIVSIGLGYLMARSVVPDYLAQEEEAKEWVWMADVLLHGIAPSD
ncbi:TetR/AcrR family transcriptional regulator [Kroppenstedtia pulmonis]|uniref:TetR/AcrR family transcriptional regulator n=1 Tax=Kroppenstedtia pulmonis TaxID=1380685 RepID=A0A7D4C7B3_9BACL|nr:TetR/AcrR family transcriptional regulator [Kroppenstedtia pulmonis]QKG84876.1 TetR/AcrR family transcriptional regulator [Kroppenstedtia pulmonis]